MSGLMKTFCFSISREEIEPWKSTCWIIIFGFPAPIILALVLNELTSQRFKRLVQPITYLPHFVKGALIGAIKE